MRFELPVMPNQPGYEAFEDCVNHAVGSGSKQEEGAFLIALSLFVERLVANVAVGRSVALLTIGTFEARSTGQLGGSSPKEHDTGQRTPVFLPSESFQLEVDDPLPADHEMMEGLFPAADDCDG